MEAAALYTFARKRGVSVLCLAHVTNTMGVADGDFEKGEADGTADALAILETITKAMCQPFVRLGLGVSVALVDTAPSRKSRIRNSRPALV